MVQPQQRIGVTLKASSVQELRIQLSALRAQYGTIIIEVGGTKASVSTWEHMDDKKLGSLFKETSIEVVPLFG